MKAISDAGLEAYQADATNPMDLSGLPTADAVVYAASASGEDGARETYVDGLETVLDHYDDRRSPPSRFVYTSSTGVYGDHGGAWVDESTEIQPTTERQETLVAAERIALERGTDRMRRVVVRFGGLYGPGRSPVERYLEGPVSPGHVNLVHRDDAAGAVAHLLTEGAVAEDIVNVVDDEPVSRPTLANWIADRFDRDPPAIVPLVDRNLSPARRRRLGTDKRVANDRLHDLGYEFAYPTFRTGFVDGLSEE